MKQPIGKCKFCGQEFMTKAGLKTHEERTCPKKIEKGESQRWKQRAQFGNRTIWIPRL